MNSSYYFDRGWRLDPHAPCMIDGHTHEVLSYERVRDLTPGRKGANPIAHGTTVQGIGVLSIECGDSDSALWQKRRIDEFGDILYSL